MRRVITRRQMAKLAGPMLLPLTIVSAQQNLAPVGRPGVPGVLLEVIDIEDPIPVGDTATYRITATNQGSAPQTRVKVVVTMEPEAQYVSSGGSTKGNLRGTDIVEFDALPRLAPKAEATWKVVVKAVRPGDVRFAVALWSNHLRRPAKETEATTFYTVNGDAAAKPPAIPAIRLEMGDVEDPVLLGDTATYVITATNQGSATGTNIKVVAVMEPKAQYVSSEGATEGTLRKVKRWDAVVFSPLPSLTPKAKAIWKVVVKAVKPGDVRFVVSLTSGQLRRPVKETEATNFYLRPVK